MGETEGRRREEGRIEKRASRMMEGTTKGRYEGVQSVRGTDYGMVIFPVTGTFSAHIVLV